MFPSDHHFADEVAFAAELETAFAAAEARPDRVMLLGVTPDYPEVGYGWVEPGAPLGGLCPTLCAALAVFFGKSRPGRLRQP